MKHLSLSQLVNTINIGDQVKAIKTESFWDAFDVEGEEIVLTFVGTTQVQQTNPIWENAIYGAYCFEGPNGEDVVLCPMDSMGCGDKSVYRSCVGERASYQLIA